RSPRWRPHTSHTNSCRSWPPEEAGFHRPCGLGQQSGFFREDDSVDVDRQPHLVEIVAALKEITARITSATALSEAVNDLLKVTCDVLPPHVQCGMTVISEGEPATFASTSLPDEVVDEIR